MDFSNAAELQKLLLDTFILEAAEQLELLDQERSAESADLEKCRRIAHTLKGSARAVGMRSAERAALHLEHHYRSQEEEAQQDVSEEIVGSWVERIRYWSEESHAKALFEHQPVALLWNTEQAQAALYSILLRREGYLVVSVSDLEQLAEAIASSTPPALLCIMEDSDEVVSKIFAEAMRHDEWSHAPTLLFSSYDQSPETMEVFCPSAKPAPGALMAGLETIREATA